MRSRLHLDDRGHAVLLHTGHDTGEPVPRRLRDDGPFPLTPILLQAPDLGQSDETLAAGRSPRAQASGSGPAAERIDRNPEEQSGLTDPNCAIYRFCRLTWHECLGIIRALGSVPPITVDREGVL